MTQKRQSAIPCLFMRGGTSRGPFFDAADLPADRDEIAEILLDVMGRCGPPQANGLGGTASVTNKAAVLSVDQDGVVQYLFAQIVPDEGRVDFAPNCGNMLVAVGPAAIEMGLVSPDEGETTVNIVNVNTGIRARSIVQTPSGKVTYIGDASIDGIAGTSAPIAISLLEPAGAKTGKLFPTGSLKDKIDGVTVSLVDCAVPTLWVRADDLNIDLHIAGRLDQDTKLMARLESMRLEAGARMGLGDCRGKVIPKIALIARPRNGGAIAARYFTPYSQHPTLALTGGICGAALCLQPGTVADGIADLPRTPGATIDIEHAAGCLRVNIKTERKGDELKVISAGAIRTARLIMRGEVYVERLDVSEQ